jgi:hypothetical protein
MIKSIIQITILFAIFVIAACSTSSSSTPSPSTSDTTPFNATLATPSGEIERVWTDDNVTVENRKGIRIHARVKYENLKGVECWLAAYFFLAQDSPLGDLNNQYCTTDGQVAARDSVIPGYKSAVSEDFTLFMPYDELHVQKNTKLMFIVRLYDTNLRMISTTYKYYYEFTVPDA